MIIFDYLCLFMGGSMRGGGGGGTGGPDPPEKSQKYSVNS